MSKDLSNSAGKQPPARAWTLMRVIGMVSVTLFIATEVLAAYGAGVWALSGLIGLGGTGTMVLGAILGLPAVYAIAKCAQLAFLAEMDPAND
jgi:hypothetical protein